MISNDEYSKLLNKQFESKNIIAANKIISGTILKISDQIDNQNDLDEARAWDRKKRQKEQNLFQAYSALGELRNNRDQEGFEQKMEQWISNMNAQGFTKEAESAAKYE